MPYYTRKRVFGAKIETTVGTAIALSNSDGNHNVFDLVIQPTGEFLERKGQGSFGNIVGVVGLRTGVATFKTDWIGDGSGGVPGWASLLLPACGWVNSAGTFSPRSEAPGSNVKTLTIASYEDGVRKMLRGAVGTFVATFKTGNIITFDWTFQGAWNTVADVSPLAPTYPTRKPLRAASGTISIGSWAPLYQTFTLNAGNVIVPREDIAAADGSGVHSCIITDRTITGTIDPEANLVATSNADVYGDWLAGEQDTFSLVAQDATDKLTLTGAAVQRVSVQGADKSGLMTDAITFNFNKSSGNDELTFAFSAP